MDHSSVGGGVSDRLFGWFAVVREVGRVLLQICSLLLFILLSLNI